ncbi:MAG: TonB-dependent receptor [Acidobacteria bacterium]|nr:TonB-dependent receptor [Acidobacteriota bacterium]
MIYCKSALGALILCILSFSVPVAFGQGGATGQISGTVVDQTAAGIPDAAIKLTSAETAEVRQTTTNSVGDFTIPLLRPGRYTLAVSASGFKTVKVENVDVRITQTTTLPVTLEAAAQVEVVTVTAEAPLVQETSSQTGRVVEERSLRQLPLPTRNFQQLLALSPGTSASLTNTTEVGRGDQIISVNGQRTTSNNVVVNGVEVNSPGTNSTPNIAVPATDAIQEFIVQTSLYDASHGRNAGGNVAAITKSGSNEFHGNVYEFFRNRVLNANDFFLNASGQKRSTLTRNQFGGTLGGPIVKDKAFFFGSYQGTRERNGASLTRSLSFLNLNFPVFDSSRRLIRIAPLTDDRSAATLASRFFEPAASATSIEPVALAVLSARLPNGRFAIPSSTNPSGSTALSGLSRFREDQFNANVDVQLTQSNKLSGKFFFSNNPTFEALFNFVGANAFQAPGYGGDFEIRNRVLSISDTHIFGSNVVNEARFGFSRIFGFSSPEEPFTAAQFGIRNPLANLFPGLPTIGVTGQFTIGSTPLADEASTVNTFTYSDTLSIISGRHNIQIGGEARRYQVNFFFNFFSRGQLIFNTFQDFLRGRVGTSLIGSGVPDRGIRATDVSAFIQDDIRVNERLTINAGFRYEYFGGLTEVRGRLVNFDRTQFRPGTAANPMPPPNGLVQLSNADPALPGVPTFGDALNPNDSAFAPRFGFSYRPLNTNQFALRGGIGVYFDRFSTRFANVQVFNYPYGTVAVALGVPFANPFAAVPSPTAFPVAPTVPAPISIITNVGGTQIPLGPVPINGIYVSRDFRSPYVYQSNLGFQWEFAPSFLLEIGYVGSKGTKLINVFNLNQAGGVTPFTCGTPVPCFSTNKNLFGMVEVQSSANSHYDSLQASVTKRLSRGLQFLASYTFSKSIDNYSGDLTNELTILPGDQQNFRSHRALSNFDRTHRFVYSFVYDLPQCYSGDSAVARHLLNTWQIAGIATLQSGLPVTIFEAVGSAVFNRVNFKPGFAGSLEQPGSVHEKLTQFFNTGVLASAQRTLAGMPNPFFDPNAPFGNSGRNILRGPDQRNLDFSLVKFIPVTEGVDAEFRTEFFNIFNTVNFALPNANIAVPATFGRITATSAGPRIIQFALKLNF